MLELLASFWQPFAEYQFMRRALVGNIALALGATPFGVFMMLRRVSLAGDAISHAILPGAALGYLVAGFSLSAMSLGGLLSGVAVALLAAGVARRTMLREDASLAVFYLISLALGVTLISLRGRNVDLLNILFGSVLALDDASLLLLGCIASLSLVTLALVYRPLVLECYDAAYLRSVSRWSAVAHVVFLVMLVLNLVAGFQALGTLMALGIMLIPAASARFWARTLDGILMVAVLLAACGSYLGLVASYVLELPAGATIVLTLGALYLASMLLGRDGVLGRALPRHRGHLQG